MHVCHLITVVDLCVFAYRVYVCASSFLCVVALKFRNLLAYAVAASRMHTVQLCALFYERMRAVA